MHLYRILNENPKTSHSHFIARRNTFGFGSSVRHVCVTSMLITLLFVNTIIFIAKQCKVMQMGILSYLRALISRHKELYRMYSENFDIVN